MTQCDRVMKYMEDFGTISQLQAIQDLGVMRLASRISDLRKDGVCIGKRTEATKKQIRRFNTLRRLLFGGTT